MDSQDYSSHYSGQSYAQYGATSSPYTSASAYQQQHYQTSSGSEHGGYDYEATSPADDVPQSSRRRSRGGTTSASSGGSSTSARRREQNRLAQRALRQRRESHIRTLEDRILHTSLETRHLASENQDLTQQLQSMRLENDSLRHTGGDHTHVATARAGAGGVPATNPYTQGGYGSQQPGSYGGVASPYQQHYAYSAASTPSSTGDPSPTCATWPYDDPSMSATHDPRYWGGQGNYADAYAQQYQQQYEDEAEDESEEEEPQRAAHSHRRRK
jgi:hypothetical protein